MADFVAKLGGRRLARNNRIRGKQFLNRCCALIAVLESMLPARALKIVLQHYRHKCDLWRRLNEGRLRQLSRRVATRPREPGLTRNGVGCACAAARLPEGHKLSG